jgi:hypothetical protein
MNECPDFAGTEAAALQTNRVLSPIIRHFVEKFHIKLGHFFREDDDMAVWLNMLLQEPVVV